MFVATVALALATSSFQPALARSVVSEDRVWTIELADRVVLFGDPKTSRNGCSGLDFVISHSSGVIPLRTLVSVVLRDGNGMIVASSMGEAAQSGLTQLRGGDPCTLGVQGEVVEPYRLDVDLVVGTRPVLRHTEYPIPITYEKESPREVQRRAEARRSLELRLAQGEQVIEQYRLAATQVSARARAEGVSPSRLNEPQPPATPELSDDGSDIQRVDQFAIDVGIYAGQVGSYVKRVQSEISTVRKQQRQISCQRGKTVRVVAGPRPKCPSGFRVVRR